MIRLRKQGQREAGRMWRQVRPNDLDGTFPLGQLELTVSTLQREAARLSSAYLATFIASELGEPERPPALSVWDKTFGGNPLREGLRSAVIKAKQAIKDGTDPTEATKAARKVLVSDVGLFIDTAARESLRQGMEMDDRIVGYQRALKGTCGACSGDTEYYTVDPNASVRSLAVHPHCQCVSEPIVVKDAKQMPDTKMSAADKKAMGEYVAQPVQSLAVNRYLRLGRSGYGRPTRWNPPIPQVEKWLKGLDRLFDRVDPLGSPVRVWRGMRLSPEDLGLSGKKLAGKIFTDKGFGSSTSIKEYANRYLNPEVLPKPSVLMEMTVDPRVKGIWGANPDVGELVLERGCRYLVKSTRRVGSKTILKVVVLPPE